MLTKRRRRFQGLYYHSSPPKVLPMNGHMPTESGRKRRETDDLSVKLSTIRIWMHEKDIGKLTRILWAGQGNRLRQQASTNAKVKRFLAAVPYVMNSIRGVHQAVIENSLETLQANLEPPVPPALVTCRDANGLNLIHKAAGLGHATILEYLIATWPDGVHECDITGKTPLHWAASAKNNMRCYTLLTQAGCDEEVVDYKMKTPSFYRHKPHDIERAFLLYVPEAPRVSPDIATDWVALSDDSGDGKKLDIKIPEMNGFGRHSNAESNENTSEAEMTEGASTADDEDAVAGETEVEPDHESEPETARESDLEEKDEVSAEPEQEEEPQVDDNAKENEIEDKQEANEEVQPAHEEEAQPQDEKLTQSTNESITEATDDKKDHVDHTSQDNKESEIADSPEEENENSAEIIDTSSAKESKEEEFEKQDDEKVQEKEKAIEENEETESNKNEEIKETENIEEKNENNENSKDIIQEKASDNDNDKEHEKENTDDITEQSTENKTQERDETNVAEEQSKEESEESEETNESKEEPEDKIGEMEIEKKIKVVQENEDTAEDRRRDNETSQKDAEKETDDDGEKESNAIETHEHSKEKGKEDAAYNDMDNKLNETDKNIKDENGDGREVIVAETVKTLKVTLKPQDNINERDGIKEEPKNQTLNNNDSLTNINTSRESESTITFVPTTDNIAGSNDIEEENNNNALSKPRAVEDEDANDVVEISSQKLSDNAKETLESGESFLQEVQQDMSVKFEEISENFKDNTKTLTDKIQNVFSSSDEKVENEENDKNSNKANGNDIDEVIVRKSASPLKSAKGPQSKGNKAKKLIGASGDDSNDETNEDEDDEESVIAAARNDNKKVSDDSSKDADKQSPPEENNVANASPSDVAGEPSHTSSLAIEGFVHGDAEDNTVQSQTAAYNDDDNEETRLKRAISSGDMEQLAQIVLNGDGQKLLDVEATEPEIQAFLRNVPNYMDKIRRVHEASRSGSLLNLQQALDRRKFAVAKDEMSPNGATPLHVAVVFGHSDIVRYLAARFPETTSITDNDGRTALHYAAIINDNGHFYNVLLQLGANPKALDLMGKTPEQYGPNDKPNENFNYRQLLKSFGAEDLDTKLLSDQGQVENHSYQENPLFKTEQGKYLADNLADPLIKALTQVAHKRPQDPLQYLTNYLQNFASTRNTNGKTLVQAAVHSSSSHSNSTALANSNQTPPPAPADVRQFQPTSQMNGHVKYDNTDDIEGEVLQPEDDDEANDSDAALSKKLEERDEHGQSMLHFACARSHRRGGLLHLIEESKADITYRDELYRTARDVALQANQVGNAKEIDRYLISLAVVGDVKPFEYFALAGYDHVIDVIDENEVSITDLADSKGYTELASYLKSIRPMEELREELHQMIRDLKVERVKEIADGENGKTLIVAKNYYGRTALHIAILKESEEIIEHIVNLCPDALKIGDNLERSPLHYAMGTSLVEGISRILIQNGAKRTYKDLKGRQPSYYFMNKADILRLQEEEDESR